MKLKAFILLISVLLSGCSTTSLKKPISSKKIGIHIKYNAPYTLCQEYYGATVFNNESSRYTIDSNLESITINAISQAITESDNTPIIIPVEKAVSHSELMTFNSWSGEPTLNVFGASYLEKLGETYGVEYIFVRFINEPIECDIRLSNQYSDYGQVNLYSLSSFNLFDIKNAKYLGMAGPKFGESYSLKMPEDINNLSKDELLKAVKVHYNKTLDYNFRLLSKSKNKVSSNN
ncbi:hypothetical protein EXT48_16925 [Pseudoalteromonas sp. CO348]|uniref:hypothetical protein n=1 Tax=unclassified Pseudoalteromonas TaxID=194690 RepID=UPI0010238713|nr:MULTISPECIES: hypothetical protein [unclassified Pseudoalteromonas]MCG7541065.1 hypothetical protein [Pseudoalteromonas sp. OF7H-1]RZG01010.1 hypothetical protein EXT48_16925 [Pseudoalteromonas sp. CO348]